MAQDATTNAAARIDAGASALYRRVSERAASFGVAVSPEELAELAVRGDMGADELAALEAVFTYLADKHHEQVISTLLRLSRLPLKAPRPSATSTSTAFAARTPARSAACRRCRTCTRARTSRSSGRVGSGRCTWRRPTGANAA